MGVQFYPTSANKGAVVSPYWYHRTVTRWREFAHRLGLVEVPPQLLQQPVLTTVLPEQLAQVGGLVLPQNMELALDHQYRQAADGAGMFAVYQAYYQQPNGDVVSEPVFSMVWRYNNFEATAALEQIAQVVDLDTLQTNKKVLVQQGKTVNQHMHWAAQPQQVSSTNVQYQDSLCLSVRSLGSQPNTLREQFYQFDDGAYALELFDKLPKGAVEPVLEEYLSMPYLPRLGITARLMPLTRALQSTGRPQQDEEQNTAAEAKKATVVERVVTIK